MSVIETFERKALFNITRAVALICVSLFLVAMAGAIFYGTTVWQQKSSTQVRAEEVIDEVQPPTPAPAASTEPKGAQPPTDQGAQTSPLRGYRIPFSLQKYVTGDNARVLKKHLDEVPAAERQAYLDELGTVLDAADKRHVDGVAVINTYIKMKAQRYDEVEKARARKMETLKMVGAGVGAALLLIALFSLVLVLLAIERNTRTVTNANGNAHHTVSGGVTSNMAGDRA